MFHFGNGFPNRFSGEARTIASGAIEVSPYWHQCDAVMPETFGNFCVFGDNRSREVAVIGDSHSMEIFWKMSDGLGKRPYALQAFAWHGRPPFTDPTARGDSMGCGYFRDKSKTYILDNARIGTVVFLANLPSYFDCTVKKHCLGSYENGPSYVRAQGTPDSTNLMNKDIDAYIAAGKKVIIMYPIPEMKWNVPWYMTSRLRFSQSLDETAVPFGLHKARAQKAIAFIDQEGRKPYVTTVNPVDPLCSRGAKSHCVGQINGVPLYYDQGHLNGTGANMVAGQIFSILDSQARDGL
ncbi:hypothetical protein MMA231_01431 [Asticcacaulis sp. MM231]|uniref:SGNH hydrolase domain-containing protein n=1 Tax=Asticcacaulis sp. MM231 TaxID=3157666 RepID=UPI0032D5A6FF